MKKTRIALVGLAGILAGATVLVVARRDRAPAPVLGGQALPQSGGRFRGSSSEFSAYGWSVHPDTSTAIQEALKASGVIALEPDITFVFYTNHHKSESVAESLRSTRRVGLRTCGRSSDYGIVGPDGYHASDHGVIGLLSLRLPGMKVGTGSATLDEAGSPGACAKLALRRAVEDAGGVALNAHPSMIAMSERGRGSLRRGQLEHPAEPRRGPSTAGQGKQAQHGRFCGPASAGGQGKSSSPRREIEVIAGHYLRK